MAAESAKAQSEDELFNAKKTVKSLASEIEDSNVRENLRMRELEGLKKSGKYKEKVLGYGSNEDYKYEEVMRELEYVKQELYKLKLDVALVLEKKLWAEKEIEGSGFKMRSYSRSVEALREEIENANEEQVLVELAKMEALKEYKDIEAQREKEEVEFSFLMESTKKKLKDAVEELESTNKLENKLVVTMSDVEVLQKELMLVKEMDQRVQRNESMKRLERNSLKGEETGSSPSLQTIMKELEGAKKELASIKEEGFQFMASMDIIRNELKHVQDENACFEKIQEKTDLTVKNLNSKLLRAKLKLESVSSAEEKAKSIVANLSATLEELKEEKEAAEKEKELINEEVASIKAEIRKTESETDLTEEKLEAALKELEVAKSSEAMTLAKLKSFVENTMRGRASAPEHSSLINISRFEYEYLTKHAAAAEEIANKKVAAAQAWIKALKAGEKEILMKTEMAKRKMRETRVEEEACKMEKSLTPKREVGEELERLRRKREKSTETDPIERAMSRQSYKGNGNLTPSRRGKFRKSASTAGRPLNYFALKKRKKVMPNLAKFFGGKGVDQKV